MSHGHVQQRLSRRAFLRSGLAAAAALLPRQHARAHESARDAVVEVRDPAWRSDGGVDPAVVRAMLDRGLMRLTGEGSAAGAWRRIVSPGERVGIKFSKVSRNASGANQALGDALIHGLAQAGVRRERIGTGEFDGSYGPEVDTGLARVRLSRFVREQIDALISVPELKPHPRLGASGSRSNVALATTVIDAPWRFHGPQLADHVAAIYALPAIGPKCRLHILNGLRGLGDRRDSLFLSTDPAALDHVAGALALREGGRGSRRAAMDGSAPLRGAARREPRPPISSG